MTSRRHYRSTYFQEVKDIIRRKLTVREEIPKAFKDFKFSIIIFIVPDVIFMWVSNVKTLELYFFVM